VSLSYPKFDQLGYIGCAWLSQLLPDQQLSDTELAEQRYTLMVFTDFYAPEFGFFKKNLFII
jgi:hypothetical protein